VRGDTPAGRAEHVLLRPPLDAGLGFLDMQGSARLLLSRNYGNWFPVIGNPPVAAGAKDCLGGTHRALPCSGHGATRSPRAHGRGTAHRGTQSLGRLQNWQLLWKEKRISHPFPPAVLRTGRGRASDRETWDGSGQLLLPVGAAAGFGRACVSGGDGQGKRMGISCGRERSGTTSPQRAQCSAFINSGH